MPRTLHKWLDGFKVLLQRNLPDPDPSRNFCGVRYLVHFIRVIAITSIVTTTRTMAMYHVAALSLTMIAVQIV